MSQTSWLRLPITSVICRRKVFSRPNGTCPNTLTFPSDGCSRPESIFRVVVLPAPLGPKKPTTSPGCTAKVIFLTASTVCVWRCTRLLSAAPSPPSRTGTT